MPSQAVTELRGLWVALGVALPAPAGLTPEQAEVLALAREAVALARYAVVLAGTSLARRKPSPPASRASLRDLARDLRLRLEEYARQGVAGLPRG